MMPSDGIIISCNNSTEGNGFSDSILGVSLPNNTNDSSIIGSVVLLNDTEDTMFNTLSTDDQVAVPPMKWPCTWIRTLFCSK